MLYTELLVMLYTISKPDLINLIVPRGRPRRCCWEPSEERRLLMESHHDDDETKRSVYFFVEDYIEAREASGGVRTAGPGLGCDGTRTSRFMFAAGTVGP